MRGLSLEQRGALRDAKTRISRPAPFVARVTITGAKLIKGEGGATRALCSKMIYYFMASAQFYVPPGERQANREEQRRTKAC